MHTSVVFLNIAVQVHFLFVQALSTELCLRLCCYKGHFTSPNLLTRAFPDFLIFAYLPNTETSTGTTEEQQEPTDKHTT